MSIIVFRFFQPRDNSHANISEIWFEQRGGHRALEDGASARSPWDRGGGCQGNGIFGVGRSALRDWYAALNRRSSVPGVERLERICKIISFFTLITEISFSQHGVVVGREKKVKIHMIHLWIKLGHNKAKPRILPSIFLLLHY